MRLCPQKPYNYLTILRQLPIVLGDTLYAIGLYFFFGVSCKKLKSFFSALLATPI